MGAPSEVKKVCSGFFKNTELKNKGQHLLFNVGFWVGFVFDTLQHGQSSLQSS